MSSSKPKYQSLAATESSETSTQRYSISPGAIGLPVQPQQQQSAIFIGPTAGKSGKQPEQRQPKR